MAFKSKKSARRDDDDRVPAKRKSTFNYRRPSYEKMKQRAERSGRNFDSPIKSGFDTFRPKDGSNYVRWLPATWDDSEYFLYQIWVHRRIGADNSNYLCLYKMKQERCPICAASARMTKRGDPDEAKKLAAYEMYAGWVIDRDGEPDKPLVYIVSWSQEKDIVSLTVDDRNKECIAIDEPGAGFDMQVKRTGKDLGTRYNFILDRKSSPLADDQETEEEILEYIKEHPIPSVLHYYDAAYLERVLSGIEASGDDDLDDSDEDSNDHDHEEEEARVSRRSRRRDEDEDEEPPPRRSRQRDRDEDEDVEEESPRSRRRVREDEEDEEYEDEPPRRRRASSHADEDEEEEEAPRRRSRRELQ